MDLRSPLHKNRLPLPSNFLQVCEILPRPQDRLLGLWLEIKIGLAHQIRSHAHRQTACELPIDSSRLEGLPRNCASARARRFARLVCVRQLARVSAYGVFPYTNVLVSRQLFPLQTPSGVLPIDAVVNCIPIRVYNITKLTNLMKIS